MKSTLEKRILLFSFLIIGLTIAVNTVLTIEGFRRDYREGLILRAQSLGETLKVSLENMIGHGIPLNDIDKLPDRCADIVDLDPEMAYCLVEDSFGKPLLASDNAFRFGPDVKVVKAVGPLTALLEFETQGRYYDISKNLFAQGGTLSGRVRIGFAESVLKDHIVNILERSLLVLVGAFLVVFTLVYLFVRRDLIGPMVTLRSVAREIATGHFNVRVPELSTRDFSDLGNALEEMARSLEDRDGRIRQNLTELEQTNLQLQESYESLERVGAELGRSREMYRSLLDDASDAIVVSDDHDRVVLINKAAEQFFGFSRKDIRGSNLYSFLEKLQVANIEELYRLHGEVLQGRTHEAEVRFMSPATNRLVIGWVKASPVTGRDGRQRVQSIVRDVTGERETQENLERSTAELQRLNQMKDSFLGVASHELKTPLTVIMGYTELLLNEWHDRLDPTVMSMLEHVATASERLSNIVRDMVDVSMLEEQQLKLRLSQVSINQAIEQAARELEFFFDQRQQNLVLELAPDLPEVECDPARIAQVLANLIGNAIKFTPDGGTITVSSQRVSYFRPWSGPLEQAEGVYGLLAEEKQPYLMLSIRDDGIGIDDADQPHVFDKFYEVGNIEEHFTGKVAFKGKGTGLGLAIVKGIVDLHRGEVWVESPGNDPQGQPGCTFKFILPLHSETPVQGG